jgi:hypothetical protein
MPSKRLNKLAPEKISSHAHVKSAPNEANEKKATRLSRSGRYDAIKLTSQTTRGRFGLWAITILPFESLNIFIIKKV